MSAPEAAPECYRHPGRETWIRCQRCDRPICPDCMRPAAVGFQCPNCVKEGVRSTRQTQSAFGGKRSADPRLTSFVLIGINVLAWLAIMATGGNASPLLASWVLQPYDLLPPSQGGRLALWQLLTSAFTHLEIWHLAMNMFGLYLLGPVIEQALGRWRFLAVYLLSALGGSVAVLFLSGGRGALGASGAIYGLMAALLVLAVRRRADTRDLLVLIGINVAISVAGRSFISWEGHFGGFVAGALATAAIVWAPRDGRGRWQTLLLALVLGLLLAGVAGYVVTTRLI